MKYLLYIIIFLFALIAIYFATKKADKIYEPYENPRPRVLNETPAVWPDSQELPVEKGKDKG